MFQEIITAYNEAIFDTDHELAVKVIHDAVEKGVSPEDIVSLVIIP
ncbi:MAG: cobalamin-binding protein, partial [Deltaproteobacteria bacterium]|nr:cobalamin-binding protein [Deltaproteobacteria bacterium]